MLLMLVLLTTLGRPPDTELDLYSDPIPSRGCLHIMYHYKRYSIDPKHRKSIHVYIGFPQFVCSSLSLSVCLSPFGVTHFHCDL